MRLLLLTLLSVLLLATSSDARPERTGRTAASDAACRLVQRKVQSTLPRSGGRLGERIRTIGAASRVVRSAVREGDVSRRCAACILRQVVRAVPLAEQRPCGSHDVCAVGYHLTSDGDACVSSVCERDRRCCRSWWGRRCVAAVSELCEGSCGACAHPACKVGAALPTDCSDCTRRVCAADPYCCDTAWDVQCASAAASVCAGACQTTSTTVVKVSTTLLPTTTVPICRTDDECGDDDPCTVDTCDREHGCIFERYSCDDGDPCTTDACDGVGGCAHDDRPCDAGECTADACDRVLGCAGDVGTGACRVDVDFGRR